MAFRIVIEAGGRDVWETKKVGSRSGKDRRKVR